jgi:hypothetical protein
MILIIIGIVLLIIAIIVTVYFLLKNTDNFDGIVSKDCNNNGYLDQNKNCVCLKGWTGDKCQFTNCNNNGTIDLSKSMPGGPYVCKCNPEWTGQYCGYSDSETCFGNGKVDYEGNCDCNKVKMYMEGTGTGAIDVDLYKDKNCKTPVKLSDEFTQQNFENLYLHGPPDGTDDYIYDKVEFLKLCPFHDGIDIQNAKCEPHFGIVIDDKDKNNCVIIKQGEDLITPWPLDNTRTGTKCTFDVVGKYGTENVSVVRQGYKINADESTAKPVITGASNYMTVIGKQDNMPALPHDLNARASQVTFGDKLS